MAFLWMPTVVISILFAFANANYESRGRTNVAMYYGQGPYQQRLLHFCQQSTVDIIPLAFVNIFPAQGNGFPGTNFGNQCSGSVYAGPGNDSALNSLLSSCPELVADIPVCQSQYGKKIILSLGGGLDTYSLTGAANGTAFANFLWGAFGPQTKSWLAQGLPRPFDGPNNTAVEVDGFDFDIEFPSSDNQAGYISMIQRLRNLFVSGDKKYLITGAPQCVVPDANMGQMISQAEFDIIWIQYYNTPQCSARNWVTANPNYTTTGVEEPSGFSFNAWEQALVGTRSSHAKLYIGLPGSTTAAGSTFYLSPNEASSLIKAYYCKANFGGIMIWESTYADNNNVGCGETYYEAVKNILLDYSQDGALSCVTAPKTTTTSKASSCTITATTTTSSTALTPTPTPPCTEVYVVQPGDYCYLIWTEFGITEAQLYSWNPTLDSNCDLQIGQVLCVSESPQTTSVKTTTTSTQSVSTTKTSSSATATASACTKYYTVQSGDYCYAIWTEFGITEAQLYAFNPSLDSNCDLQVGQVLCVSETPSTSTSTKSSSTSATSTTSASATPTACTKYYTVQSGDYCYAIWTEFGITEAQLYAYNPSLDSNCDLSVGQVLCVSESPVSSSSTSTTFKTTTTAKTSSSSTSSSKTSTSSSKSSTSSTTPTTTSKTSTISSSSSTSKKSSVTSSSTSSSIKTTSTATSTKATSTSSTKTSSSTLHTTTSSKVSTTSSSSSSTHSVTTKS